MQRAAQARGLSTRYRFEVLPGVGHDFTSAMELGGMGEAVFGYVFGADETAPSARASIAAAALPGAPGYPGAGTPGGAAEDRALLTALAHDMALHQPCCSGNRA